MDPDGSYIMDKDIGVRMRVQMQDHIFVFDTPYECGQVGTITLDSRAAMHGCADKAEAGRLAAVRGKCN